MSGFTAHRSGLLTALTAVREAVDKRGTIPILTNVLIKAAGDGEIVMIGTDLDLQFSIRVEAECEDFTAVTVPARMLFDFVRRLPESSDVHLNHDDRFASVTATNTKARIRLAVLPAQDFPILPKVDSMVDLALDPTELQYALQAVEYAISNEEVRYYLNGAFITAAGKELHFVATDGHRLAKVAMPAPKGMPKDLCGVILPAKAVRMVLRMLSGRGEDDGELVVGHSESRLTFRSGMVEIETKLIDGTFPDYERVIPKNNEFTFTVPVETLSAAVGRVELQNRGDVAKEHRNCVVRFEFRGGTLALSSRNTDGEEAADEIDTQGEGEAAIGFAGKYVLDTLASCTAPRSIWRIGGPSDPAVIEPEGRDDTKFVIMPRRL